MLLKKESTEKRARVEKTVKADAILDSDALIDDTPDHATRSYWNNNNVYACARCTSMCHPIHWFHLRFHIKIHRERNRSMEKLGWLCHRMWANKRHLYLYDSHASVIVSLFIYDLFVSLAMNLSALCHSSAFRVIRHSRWYFNAIT